MKYIEVESDAVPVSDTAVVRHNEDGNNVMLSTGFGRELVVFSADFIELSYEPTVRWEVLKWFACCLVKSRLAAELAAPHIHTITRDHYEFIACVLLEQKEHLTRETDLSFEYVQDWQRLVATRVHSPRFVIVGEGEQSQIMVRYSTDQPGIVAHVTAPDRYSVCLHRSAAESGGGAVRWVCVWSLAQCQAALKKLESTLFNETITSIELSRWVDRHTKPENAQTPPPGRVVHLPDPVERTASEAR